MARQKKEESKEESCTCDTQLVVKITVLEEIVKTLVERVAELERPKAKTLSINKLETFNGEEESDVQIKDSRMKFTEEETIYNIRNIIKIMPPNLVDKEGKQSYANIRALGGPHLTDEVIDKAYEGLNLEP